MSKDFILQKEVISMLRRLWRRSRHKALAKQAVKSERTVFNKDGSVSKRHCVQYECEQCHGQFTDDEVEVDHIDPVIDPNTGFVDWNTFISRLFVNLSIIKATDTPDLVKGKLQVLCKTCHSAKSVAENKERRKNATSKRKSKSEKQSQPSTRTRKSSRT